MNKEQNKEENAGAQFKLLLKGIGGDRNNENNNNNNNNAIQDKSEFLNQGTANIKWFTTVKGCQLFVIT